MLSETMSPQKPEVDHYNVHVAAVRVNANANAGGAASPIGDITTILLWIAGIVSFWSLTMYSLIPSLVYQQVIKWWFASRITTSLPDAAVVKEDVNLTKAQKILNMIALAGFSLPVIMMWNGGLAVAGLIVNLCIVLFVYIRFCRNVHTHDNIEEELDHVFGEVDQKAFVLIFVLLFGIFATQMLGGTDLLILGQDASFWETFFYVVFLGLLSCVIENVALVLLAIVTIGPLLHLYAGMGDLLALVAGVGGNLNLLGSVPGAILAGRIPSLTTRRYMQIGTLPNLIAYFASVATWLLLVGIYTLLGWR